ncbi:MAG: hypothetical protein JNM43_07600 [Planctomycetaceae bacterium]|nr:hypothetical protein [Planctomycetaceae bacterium]
MLALFNPDALEFAPGRVSVLPKAAGFELAAESPAHRIDIPGRVGPGVTEPAAVPSESTAGGPRLPAVDPRVLEISAAVSAGNVRLTVPAGSAERFAALPLRAWYNCETFGPGAQRVADVRAGKTKAGTAEKDLTALNLWERFTRPADWIGEWPGVSIVAISDAYLAEFVAACLRSGLSAGYVAGVVNHLSWFLSIARARGVLPAVPRKPNVKKLAVSVADDDSGDELGVVYETRAGSILDCVGSICQQLAGSPELQDAFVLACSVGLRPSDLFSLTAERFGVHGGQPCLRITPEKTRRHGKTLRLPLSSDIVKRLESRGRLSGGVLFPSLVGAEAANPEKSRAARRRNAQLRAAAEAAGFVFPPNRRKPWQIARATCNERLERHRKGAGEYMLGHSSGSVNARHYRQRWSEVCEAVNTLPQPAAFLEW